MLSRFQVRNRYHEPSERPRGATRSAPNALQLWQGILAQVSQRTPWKQLGLALVIALLAGSIPWVSGTVLDALDRQITGISVRGDLKGVSQADLESRLQPWLGRSFFASDLEAVKASIEQEPWVNTAAVRRVWPGRLIVEVVEHEPVAFWNESSLMTRDGQIITPDSLAAAGALPQLSGPADRAGEILDTAYMLSQKLASDDLRLRSLSQEARGAWSLKLDNGIVVELGRDRIEERLDRFLAVYRSHLKIRVAEVAGVDARYSNGIAVRWKENGEKSTEENI